MQDKSTRMNKKITTPADYELLAPAGDIYSFDTAIACGADAVYLGLSDFNARRKAENFGIDNLRECVKKAHFFGVKVYVTVNTLVGDGEMGELLSLVRSAAEAKADAFIVQDLGVAVCLKKVFPGIVLHASTQLGVHNLYGARQAEKFGFKRVVLSRETKLEDIIAIREGTALELEYFVQGALCVAFSGSCYLSAKECGASGNRGLCKQLCRLPYKAELNGEIKEGYLLSAKDLCLANSLKDLTDAGVTSFKIEGRMRRSEYVGSAVSVYRKLLDGVINNNSAARLSKRAERDLRIAYSRGDGYLERAYLDDGTPFVIQKQFNNHTGIKAGFIRRVKSFKSDLYEVTVQSDVELKKGDGLKFFRANRADAFNEGRLTEAASAGIGDVRRIGADLYSFVTKAELKEGWQVNIISSGEQNERINGIVRKVDIDLGVRALADEALTVTAHCDYKGKAVNDLNIPEGCKVLFDDNGITLELKGDICPRAISAPADEDTLVAQLIKVGDSGFAVRKASACTDNAFVAKSAVNALRRKAVEIMTEVLICAREQDCARTDEMAFDKILNETGRAEFNTSRRLRFISGCELKNGDGGADIRTLTVLRPKVYSVKNIRDMLSALRLTEDKIALQLPVMANGRDLRVIDNLLGELKGIKTLVSENIYGPEFAGRGYKVIAGAGHNAYNRYACEALKSAGACEVLPSLELGLPTAKDEIPLMTFAHCPYKTLFENDCAQCSYKDGLTLSRGKRKYRIERIKLNNCYFGMFEE